jgi:hypothetical protein
MVLEKVTKVEDKTISVRQVSLNVKEHQHARTKLKHLLMPRTHRWHIANVDAGDRMFLSSCGQYNNAQDPENSGWPMRQSPNDGEKVSFD